MRKKFFLALLIFIAIFSFGENADAIENHGKNIYLIENELVNSYFTKSETVKEFLLENRINLNLEDDINKKLGDEILDGMSIKIERPFVLDFFVNDKEKRLKVKFNDKVSDLIKKIKSEYKKDFICNREESCRLRNCSGLRFYSREIKYIERKEEILFETEIIEGDDIKEGEEKILQDGEKGDKIIIEEVIYINGQESKRDVKSEKIIKMPVKKIIKRGTGKYKKILKMQATAYTAGFESTGKRPGDKNYGITATGKKAEYGVVAVDPRVIPLGSKLYVENYGYATASDTGGKIKGNKIDLFYDSLSMARKFGKKNLNVYVLN